VMIFLSLKDIHPGCCTVAAHMVLPSAWHCTPLQT
jgi:hypothetical protein